MKPQTHSNPNDLDPDLALLDAQLRRSAEQIHPAGQLSGCAAR